VDDEAVHLEAFRQALEPLGVSFADADYWDRYIGFDDREGFAAILSDAGRPAPTELVDELILAKRPLYLSRARQTLKTFPGAVELVRRQAELGPVVVVSGALRDEIEFGLEWLQIRDSVDHVVAAEDTRASKPDPEGYLLALDWLGQRGRADAARQAVVFEDSLAGIAAAKAAGLCCVAIGHSYPMDKLRESGADLVVEAIARIEVSDLAELYAATR
jgi:HAD superfamily hydrolase (TIGR01509 family)